MKKIKIFYWIFTILFALLMVSSSIPALIGSPEEMESFRKMNLPVYLPPFLGVAKILGVIAILIPGYPRLKEWAYAGLVFDLVGATYCIKASSQSGSDWLFMALPLLLAAGAYIFYHKKLSLSGDHGSISKDQQNQPGHTPTAGFVQ